MVGIHKDVRKRIIGETLADMKNMDGIEISHMDPGVASPDTGESPGAKLLESVRDAVMTDIGNNNIQVEPSDHDNTTVEGIGFAAPSIYIGVMWSEAGDLEAYHESIDDASGTLLDITRHALSVQCTRVAMELVAWFRSEFELRAVCDTCGYDLDDSDFHASDGTCLPEDADSE